jgi:hypothetical protein
MLFVATSNTSTWQFSESALKEYALLPSSDRIHGPNPSPRVEPCGTVRPVKLLFAGFQIAE